MDNFIYKVEKALTIKECSSLIDLFKDPKFQSSISKGPNNRYTEITANFSYEALTIDATCSFFTKILANHLNQYVQKYKFLNTCPFRISQNCNLQKYQPGESFSKEHCENDGSPGPPSMRNLAWMFYLNDINFNGGTCFPSQDLILLPRAGDLYIWPAYWTHSHYGIAAEREVKYILTGWCQFLNSSELDEMSASLNSQE